MNLLNCVTSSEFLAHCLKQKQQKNRRYSMRKFARDLDFSPSGLCEVLKGRKRLSEDATLRVSTRLKLGTKEAKYFSQLCSYERCRSPELKSMIQEQIGLSSKGRKLVDLEVDVFKTLSEWHHAGIIAACDMTENMTTQKVARLLRIPLTEAVAAIERLKRLDLIGYDVIGNLTAIENDIQVATKDPSSALQEFTRQMMKKADESQQEQSNEERIFGTETFAFDEKDLPKLRELTDEFYENVVRLAKKGRNKKSVYTLGLQIFRLSRKESL